jgi:hypothetical protein
MMKSMMGPRQSNSMMSTSWLGGRILLELHHGGVKHLDEDSHRDVGSFGAKLGEDIYCDVVIPEDMMKF